MSCKLKFLIIRFDKKGNIVNNMKVEWQFDTTAGCSYRSDGSYLFGRELFFNTEIKISYHEA